MDKVRIIGPDGKPYEAVRVGLRDSHELWNEYLLEDGSVLRAKLVLTEVFRISDMYDANGSPVYQVLSQTVVSVNAASDLRKPQ